ncbi:MAG: hypothetical protein LKJ86_00400 [Oscillibacter sp.]|jgi:D-alanyl-D-alanine carboxypeptidase|nr:hypothetical protein [Oscillibacter sp.]
MKKIITTLLLVIAVCGLVGCGEKTASEVKIDYGNSTLYSEEDMDEAIDQIKAEFNTWDGCELHSISYGSDDDSNSENIAWMNDLKDGESSEPFTQCILFKSDFHSPKKGGGAWEADEEYTDWQWWLARCDGGTWELMTWGY